MAVAELPVAGKIPSRLSGEEPVDDGDPPERVKPKAKEIHEEQDRDQTKGEMILRSVAIIV
jgi:hypothetical protein